MEQVLHLATHVAVDLLHEAGPVPIALAGHHTRCSRVADLWQQRLAARGLPSLELTALLDCWRRDVMGSIRTLALAPAPTVAEVHLCGIKATVICRDLERFNSTDSMP